MEYGVYVDLIIVKYPKPYAIYLRGTIWGSSGSLDLDKQVLSYRCSSVPENLKGLQWGPQGREPQEQGRNNIAIHLPGSFYSYSI